MRLTRTAVTALLTLAACTSVASPPQTPSATGGDASSIGSTSPGVSPPLAPVMLPRLVLDADLRERSRGWEEVLAVPFRRDAAPMVFGSHHQQGLGFITPDCCGGLGPTSFAIAEGPDRSYWITDPSNQRLVRVLPTGRIVETIWNGDPHWGDFDIDDIATAPGGVYGIIDSYRGWITWITSDATGPIFRLTDGRHRLSVDLLFYSAGALHASVSTWNGGWEGIGTVDPLTGMVTPEPGAPVGDGWIAIDNHRKNHRVRWYGPGGLEATRIGRFRLIGQDGKLIPSYAEIFLQSATPAGVAAAVGVWSENGTAPRGGQWYLWIPSDPVSTPVFVRMPEGDFDMGAVQQRRMLLMGDDGRAYLMLIRADGVQILARETP